LLFGLTFIKVKGMKYSKLFGKTVKTVPAQIKAASHRLLYQGGFIRAIAAGRYAFLPLGLRVWQKIFNIIEEEMQALGSLRVMTPTLHPIEIWQATNRDVAFGDLMLTVKDHHGATFAIGATAEGLMVELVKKFRPSYKDLPIIVHQFVQKFRDEKRPRGGLLRTREFMMKDAYSFCATEKQSLEVYQQFYDCYLRIAKRLDLAVIPVEAESGALGGEMSHEMMVLAEAGEDRIFICDHCGYAANIEKAEFRRVDLTPQEKMKPLKIVKQPAWVTTMADNVKHYGLPLYKYLKNVVYKTDKGKIIIASCRGDQEINEAKLKRALKIKGELQPATAADLKKIGTKPGYVHSWGIKGVTFVGDLGLKMVKNFVGGQKEETTDAINVNYGRDFKYKILADIVNAKDGDPCARCQKGILREKRGIEFGHVFKQDHFYTRPQKGYFVDRDGKRKPMWMGAYGIGIGRAMAIIVETHHDQQGIIWPASVAPFVVHLLDLPNEPAATAEAEKIYESLNRNGIEVLWDDRQDVSAGVKFADADLIGIPVRLVVSKKLAQKNRIEYKRRAEKKTAVLSLEQVLRQLANLELS